jgi:hypothetical protein
MRIDSAALLKGPEIYNGACVGLHKAFSHSLLNHFSVLIRTTLQVARGSKLAPKHILFQKPDKLGLSHKLTICKADFLAEILEFAVSKQAYEGTDHLND